MSAPARRSEGAAGPPGEGLLEPAEVSHDAFYRGRFHLVQPKRSGFRAGLDALLLAAALPPASAGRAADVGSGTGAVGFALACRCPALAITLIERNPAMAELARAGLELSANAAIAARLSVVEADVCDKASREAAGLGAGRFDAVATNPPFHPPGHRPSPDRLRAEALSPDEEEGGLARWMAAAAGLLRPRGTFAMIARPENLPAILAAAPGRLGDLRIVPVHARADRPAIRLVIRARAASRASLRLAPPLVLRDAGGAETETAAALAAGEASLGFGD